MKKIFPVIVVLIALSLIGLIILQVSWLSNLLVVQQDRFLYKVDKAAFEVTQDLARHAINPTTRLQSPGVLRLIPDDFTFGMSKPPTLSQRFSNNEIQDKIKEAFVKEGLHNLHFEFAITSDYDNYNVEMNSQNYLKESEDTSHHRLRFYSIIPNAGNTMSDIIGYENLFVIIPNFKTQVWHSVIWMIIGSSLFTLVIIAAFFLTVKTMLDQRRLSKIKSDFINNMTHEFKTPLATISLAVDALGNDKVQNDTDKRSYFSGIIKEENKRMNKHVETILQAALMDRQELKLNFVPVHVHDIIKRVADSFQLQLAEKQGSIALQLNAKNDVIQADELHFTNLIINLIDNAVKYSKEKLHIIITTHCTAKYVAIQVQDNGIGMSKETVKRIFEKFYRAHTGNLHNVKGFGLGMSYVKNIIDAHKGKIKVESTLGKGSTFTIEIPSGNKAS